MALGPTLRRFLDDLRRRHIFRVGAVYLAMAFVILQVVDLMVDPLGLPAWTMALLIVVLAAGFLLTLVLAWAFELTPDGVQRTRPLAGVPKTPDPTRASGWRSGALVAAAAVVVLLGGAWMARGVWGTTGEPTPDSASAVAVLPFRVTGAGADLAYMREGMVDLLTATLTERGGVATVSPRLLSRELGGADDGADARTGDAVRRLGGTRIITGEVVGRPDHLTVTAALRDLDGEEGEVRASVSGSERELDRLVERLAAQLLAGRISSWRGGGGSLDDVPVPALREYLAATALQRQGRFSESLDHLRRALEIDSTFAQAALALEVSAGWATVPEQEYRRARGLAWAYRHRLSPLDRLQLEGMLGPAFPDVSAPAVRLRVVENALTAMPDRAELWYLYGDILFHEGQAIGAADWQHRAIAAFERASEIAPEDPEAEIHLLELALLTGDSAMLRDVAARVLQRDTVSELRRFVNAAIALLEDRPAAWDAWRAGTSADGPLALANVAYRALGLGRGTEAVLDMARELEQSAVTTAEAAEPTYVQIQILANTGRPAEALGVAERHLRRRGPSARPEHLQLVAWLGYAWDGDSAAGRVALEELRAMLDAEQARPGAEPAVPFHVCTVAVLDLLEGRADWAAHALPWLTRGATELEDRWVTMQARACPVIIEAGLAHVRGPPAEARQRLSELETYLTESPFGAKRLRQVANLLAASLHEAQGDLASALVALRRLQDVDSPNLLTTALREEGALLERLGRHDEAAAVYRHYLALREHAEPALRAADEPIRARLAVRERVE